MADGTTGATRVYTDDNDYIRISEEVDEAVNRISGAEWAYFTDPSYGGIIAIDTSRVVCLKQEEVD